MPNQPARVLDARMVRTADALLSVAEALLSAPWPPPDGDITGFLRLADLSITSVEPDGGHIATSDGLLGTCAVSGSHLSAVTFEFDRLRPEQLQLAEVITEWFSTKFGRPFDSGGQLPRSRRWRVNGANVVLEWRSDPAPRATLQLCRDEDITELGAAARAMANAVQVFANAPLPDDPRGLPEWFGAAGVFGVESEPGQGLLVRTTRRLGGHWTGAGVPDEVYLTAHGEPDWLDELARRTLREITVHLGPPGDESTDPGDGTRLHEWHTDHAEAGLLRSPARGITGIFVSRLEAEFPTGLRAAP
ncbi:hypothetical protein [Enemella sp. A6]|uniref:hypothetical protein n=1 Tax=Enemella sp. A6 TaxID=3440152 RepID=UPI003EBDAC55